MDGFSKGIAVDFFDDGEKRRKEEEARKWEAQQLELQKIREKRERERERRKAENKARREREIAEEQERIERKKAEAKIRREQEERHKKDQLEIFKEDIAGARDAELKGLNINAIDCYKRALAIAERYKPEESSAIRLKISWCCLGARQPKETWKYIQEIVDKGEQENLSDFNQVYNALLENEYRDAAKKITSIQSSMFDELEDFKTVNQALEGIMQSLLEKAKYAGPAFTVYQQIEALKAEIKEYCEHVNWEANKFQFCDLVKVGDEFVKNRQYQEALNKFNEAKALEPSYFPLDPYQENLNIRIRFASDNLKIYQQDLKFIDDLISEQITEFEQRKNVGLTFDTKDTVKQALNTEVKKVWPWMHDVENQDELSEVLSNILDESLKISESKFCCFTGHHAELTKNRYKIEVALEEKVQPIVNNRATEVKAAQASAVPPPLIYQYNRNNGGAPLNQVTVAVPSPQAPQGGFNTPSLYRAAIP